MNPDGVLSTAMPLKSEIDSEKRLVSTLGWGELTLKEIQQHEDILAARPDFNSDFDEIAEYSESLSAKISGAEVQALATRSIFSATSRRAIVAPSSLVFGLSRMFEAYYSMLDNRPEIRIFHTRSEALRWLGMQ